MLTAVGFSALAACFDGTDFSCSGFCHAPDGGSVTLSEIITADLQIDAEGTCLQQMGDSLGTYCSNGQNAFCGCSQK